MRGVIGVGYDAIVRGARPCELLWGCRGVASSRHRNGNWDGRDLFPQVAVSP